MPYYREKGPGEGGQNTGTGFTALRLGVVLYLLKSRRRGWDASFPLSANHAGPLLTQTETYPVQNWSLAMLQQLFSRTQPQHWIKSLDPWVQNFCIQYWSGKKKSTKIKVGDRSVGWGSSTRRGGGRKVRALPRKFVFLGFRREESGMSRDFRRDVPDPWRCSKSSCKKSSCAFFVP